MARGMNALKTLDRRHQRLVRSFMLLDTWGLTPLDLGADSWDDVDPLWEDAMIVIKGGVQAGRESERKRLVDSQGRKL